MTAVRKGKIRYVLEVKDLYKHFGGLQAISGISFGLHENKILGLMGPNGAGKTTLSNLITGFLKPDQGTIYYQGRDITALHPHLIARQGVIRSFQDLRLFGQISVLENVMVAFKDQNEERIWRWILGRKRMRLQEQERMERARALISFVGLSGKEDTIVHDLAYAEQKLLSIARLLACELKVLILDEPTSGVDPVSLKEIIAIIRKLPSQGITIVLIEHNLDTIRELADEVIFLDQGAVIARGSMEEITGDPELGRIYFGK